MYNRQALALLKQVLPNLRSYKHRRAELILENYLVLTPRIGKYNIEMLAKKEQFENLVLSLKANS